MNGKTSLETLGVGDRIDAARLALWSDAAGLLATFDAIGREGAVAVVKVDGARPDGSIYSVVVSGGRLRDDFFRKDGNDLAALLSEAITFYRDRVWSEPR
jgi:hypothetical protein